ncbi:MAG: RNA polymerase II transcription factor B subunit 4 [Stictis urceolatum]|nr:RNA polymerase II transcription factor B subunit 4 [Stictis urceolata]
MEAIDGSDHLTKDSDELPPSLLTIIIDTTPQAWAHLEPALTLSSAIANLLVFINAHLAFNNANQVSIIASHTQRAEFLYPSPLKASNPAPNGADVEMSDALNGHAPPHTPATDDANFYRPFAAISSALTASLSTLLSSTPDAPSAPTTPTSSLAGALTLALTYNNRISLSLSPHPTPTAKPSTSTSAPRAQAVTSRILVLAATPSSPAQYIPLMNTIFAAQRLHIPIDVLALLPSASPFLQQAADATNGIYASLAHPHGLLQSLMQAFLPAPPSRAWLVPPGQISVDFRAACFCHRRVVDVGFVCSVCLSIFCEPPEGAVCLTCGIRLRLGEYGARPAVVRRKRRRRREEGEGTPGVGTPGVGTPRA